VSGGQSEIEVKLHVPDLEAVAARLDALGAVLEKPRLHEYNIRYENAAGTLTEQKIILRLRRDDGVRLTYKAPQAPDAIVRGIHDRFEAETDVGDFATMNTILTRLGFQPFMVYEKYRTTYTYRGAEVVLDEMPFGNFVEVEGDEPTINRVIAELDLDAVPRIPYSYGQLFERVKAALNLSLRDLTFENFREVHVPADVLLG
jgi:adenylate cyclase class 2